MQRCKLAILSKMFLVLAFAVSARAAGQTGPEAVAPTDGPIVLFNGKDMGMLYTRLRDTKDKQKDKDPRGVFTVHDGMLHISGDGFGGVVTKQAYRDYHLVFEFKWGPRTWGPRKTRAKDSGVMFHVTGPEEAFGGWLPEAFQCQLQQGGTGDFYVVKAKGPTPVSATCEVVQRNQRWYWKKDGERRTFDRGGVYYSKRDPNWKNVLGFRGPNDPDSPDGQWTRVEVICDGNKATIKVNGITTVEAADLKPAAGKLWVQCEGAELFIRRWELWPIGKAPKLKPIAGGSG